MKITLVYPGIAQIGFNSFGGGTPNTNLINLGLAYIGASIKRNSTHSVDLIDLREMMNWHHFEAELEGRDPDIVGIYTNTVNFDYAMKCAQIAWRMKKTVIAGGPHATLSPEEILDTGCVDHVVTGEGEKTIVEILDLMEQGKRIESIVAGERIDDLDRLPFPDRDLYNMGRILNSPGIFPYPNRYIGIITSRGCLYNCAFCQPLERKIFGRRVRVRSLDNVIKEVKYVKEKYDANFVMFQDDCLTADREWTLGLCKRMRHTGLKWGAQSRVDTLDEDLVKALSDSGCIVLMFGFESGSDRILRFLRKGTKVDQAIEVARICRKHGILIFANYMLGIPTETKRDLKDTYDLMRRIKPEIHAPSFFSPIPGSDLYEYCKDNDLINVTSYEMFVRGAIDNKVKGVDYRLVNTFKNMIARFSAPWYGEAHYASCAIHRWWSLVGQGFVGQTLREVITLTPFLNTPATYLRRLVLSMK